MVAGFLALGVVEARADAPTFDEPVYVSAGLAAVLHHDVTLNDEHPPLPKVLAALPVLVTHPVVPANGRWSGNDEESYGAHFIAAQLAAGKLRSVTFASRLVPLAETAGVAFALFAVASELSGPLAGVLAGMLWLASPLVLGLGHLDGTWFLELYPNAFRGLTSNAMLIGATLEEAQDAAQAALTDLLDRVMRGTVIHHPSAAAS